MKEMSLKYLCKSSHYSERGSKLSGNSLFAFLISPHIEYFARIGLHLNPIEFSSG